MSPSRSSLLFVAVAVLAAPVAAQAPRAPPGRASLTVIRPLTVSLAQRLRFGRLPAAPRGGTLVTVPAAGSASDREERHPAVAEIRGDPGRAYRIVLPSDVRTSLGRHPVRRLTLHSATLGDVTRTRIGQLDATGRDTLRIGGQLAVAFGLSGGVYTAGVPLQIAYE